MADLMIASIARSRGASVVTRDTSCGLRESVDYLTLHWRGAIGNSATTARSYGMGHSDGMKY